MTYEEKLKSRSEEILNNFSTITTIAELTIQIEAKAFEDGFRFYGRCGGAIDIQEQMKEYGLIKQ